VKLCFQHCEQFAYLVPVLVRHLSCRPSTTNTKFQQLLLLQSGRCQRSCSHYGTARISAYKVWVGSNAVQSVEVHGFILVSLLVLFDLKGGWLFLRSVGDFRRSIANVFVHYFHPEDGGDTLLRNVGSYKIHTASHSIRRHSTQSYFP
jgi:hypothetical protein